MNAFTKAVNQFGDAVALQPIPKERRFPDLPQIETPVIRPSRKDVWPADVWAEMQAIYAGEIQ